MQGDGDMRIARLAALVLLIAAATSNVLTQAPSSPLARAGPTFEVVSITPNTTSALGSNVTQRPDGGITMANVPVGTLISRAYPPAAPIDMVGLPGWARSERYDVSATSSLSSPTPDERSAMLRAMLADRFKLAVHFEKREQPAFDLILARSDGRLGPGIKPVDVDCERIAAERTADAARNAGTPPPQGQRPDFNAPLPPCTVRIVGTAVRDRSGDRQGRLGDLMEGETTMANLAVALRPWTGRFVVNKTGLFGSYRVTMNFDSAAVRRGPDAASTPDAGPSVFTAVQEQLGLKLESSRAPLETLIIDRLERPTAN
jgi:uncharacterized protein (TIGR03435 family)